MEQAVCKNIQWEKINVWCCGAFFPSGNIKHHQNEAHSDNVKTGEQSYVCGKCGKSFSRQSAARIHERIHKYQFACDFCTKGFQQKSFLKKHKKICQLSLKGCKRLNKSSVTTDRILRAGCRDFEKKTKESASRPDTKEDSDTVAVSVISNAKTLVKQAVKVNAVKNVKSIDNLKSSMGADWNEKKNSCDAVTNAKVEGMSKNVNGDASVVLEDGFVNQGKIKCSEVEIQDNVKFCEKIYRNQEQFKEKEKNYLKERNGKISKKEICNICGASIVSKNMSTHVKHVHTMKGIKNFSCEYCGKSFKMKEDLARHIALHTGQKNFSCSYCDKKFFKMYEAKQCENKHNGIFRLSCHLCEYKTNWNSTLNKHVNSHLNIKPYSCPVCKLKSGRKSAIRQHMRTQHETDGSNISRLEALYPQMYIASESNEGWRNDPLFQNLVPAKQATGKSKWKDQPSVEYPTVVRNSDNNKKKIKLFSPKSQKSELFPEVDESGLNETPKHSKVSVKRISEDFGSPSLIKHGLASSENSVSEVNQTI